MTTKKKTQREEFNPYVNLGDIFGPEGNVNVILARCQFSLVRAGMPRTDIEDWMRAQREAPSYAHVLLAVVETFWMPASNTRQCRKLVDLNRGVRASNDTAPR